ncbi:cyclic lactone autoinducer peptide AgrD [Mammaliicoccus sciuri]|nr:cyclic lactone autoinducer peptide [Mammaliicoccus sciuri]MBV5105025.1 cyclic lactone autoinducer peptide [Mammaliicoccus sciuri]MEB5791538.1 cyclic lactone autoinducer peptide [Mammaliicoccus sciuri]MEB6232436.1 cyclic lactone autoinducer peptide [Mammaliicoccus sciuri]MEB8265058.1 cyclic lactone autoinducer peptide [Mammaliicoccus sciuri]MRE73352.1 cyclic lactone autoinducer peptide [Mammaliicoccus sciuri]
MNLLFSLFSKSVSNILSAIGEKAVIRGCTAFLDETEVPAELLKEKQ